MSAQCDFQPHLALQCLKEAGYSNLPMYSHMLHIINIEALPVIWHRLAGLLQRRHQHEDISGQHRPSTGSPDV